MKYTSLFIPFVVVVLVAIVGLNHVYPGENVFANGRGIGHKGTGGMSVAAFPDVCLTPPSPPAGPFPIPYPDSTIIKPSASDFTSGTKATKDGKNITIKGTKVMTKGGSESALKVTVTDKAGRKFSVNKSMLFELTDGTYCAICVEQGLLTRILRLKRAQ